MIQMHVLHRLAVASATNTEMCAFGLDGVPCCAVELQNTFEWMGSAL